MAAVEEDSDVPREEHLGGIYGNKVGRKDLKMGADLPEVSGYV